MRRILISLLILISSVTTVLAAEAGRANPRNMTFPELDFVIPTAERVVLECGMPVYLLRDPELPIVNISAMVRTGSVYEPATKSGLAALTGSVMRSGGAAGLSPEKMDDELEFMASSVESSINSDIGMVSMTSLTKNFSRTLKIFRDVLLMPGFDEQRIKIGRQHLIEGIRRQNDDPKEIAGREIIKAIYAGHPLGQVPTFESVKSITRQDLIDFHRRFFRVDNMILAISGDFDRSKIVAELNTIFGKYEKNSPLQLPEIPQPQALFSSEVLLAKKDVNQTVIRMGHLGITKDNPDLYAVRILDYILGGSFTSRLTMEIRSNQGLAYNVDSHFDVGRRFTGSFIAETETKVESSAKTISLMKKLIADMTTDPVTDQELKSAKEYIINSFMFGFTSPAAIVTQRARLEFYDYPSDYLENYRANINKVTKVDVLSAGRKYLKPEQFKYVVVGDPNKFDKPLSNFGKVRELDLKQNVQ
ncbi:MAG TPA: pitrilysin family protein [Desulfuromonadaceae bacterium]|jgi:predicted Zn-dependent peptidase